MEENSLNFAAVENIVGGNCNLELDDENLSVELCHKPFCLECVIRYPDFFQVFPDVSSYFPEMPEIAFHTSSTTNSLSESSNSEQTRNCKKIEELKNLKIVIKKLKSVWALQKDKIEILNTYLKYIENIAIKPENLNTKSHSGIEKIKQQLFPFMKSIQIASKILITLPDDNFNSFLSKIYKKIKSGDELFTFQKRIVNNLYTALFGKISIWRNKLCFHCLEQNNQGDYKELIKFKDLQKIVDSLQTNPPKNFMPFLKISDRGLVLMVKVVSSDLLAQFISLCIGECGHSYKNSEYKYSFVIRKTLSNRKCDEGLGVSYLILTKYKRVTHCSYDTECKNSLGKVDYALQSSRGNRLSKIYVVSDSSGGFDIFMAERNGPPSNYIGEIENSFSFDRVTASGKVIDCGISFKLPLI